LEEATISLRRALITPRVQRDADVAYGYGWFVRSRANGEIEQVSHTGGDGVSFAAFVWRPLDRSFFYLVTNTGNDGGAALASKALRVLRDR
jgi:CubicO group peptidase (beta-lactamase class C family)